MRFAARLSFVLALLVVLSPPQARAEVFGAEGFTLDNGMQVVVIPNHRVPVVSHMVWYKVGSADEQLGHSGIAHFLEHLMFKGTPTHPEGAINNIVARNGGNQNAFTSYDFTAYYQNIAVDRLPLMMELEADRMRNLILSEEDVEVEREVVLEERRMRVDSRPWEILSERLDAALWLNNHYGIPIIGWESEIRALGRDEAFAFYQRWYAPNNAILVVAGDITAEELKPLAESTYGTLEPVPEVTSRERPTALAPSADVRVTMTDPTVRQPRWQRSYIVPSVNVGDQAEVYALKVLSDVLGSGSTSLLYQSLVVSNPVAASVFAGYRAEAVSWGQFYLGITPNPGADMAEAEAALEAELDRLLGEGIPADEIERAKSRLLAEVVYAKDSPNRAAQMVGSMLAIGMSIEDIESQPERIEAVTPEQVNAAMRRLFTEAPSGTGVLLPEENV